MEVPASSYWINHGRKHINDARININIFTIPLFGNALEVPSLPLLNRHSLLMVFLAISGFTFCLQVNDLCLYMINYLHLILKSHLMQKQIYPSWYHSRIHWYSHLLAEWIHLILVNGSIGSEDDNGTEIVLRGLLTDLGDKGRWKSLLDKGLEKLQQKYPDKHLLLEYLEPPTNDTRKNFSD